MTGGSAIFAGPVIHERVRPKPHRLRYRVFSLLLDLDELPDLDSELRLFAHNRRGLFAFHDRDHGPATGAPLRPWVEDRLREAGLAPDGGPIRLLCYPRLFGYVFNPLSVFFCYDRNETLTAILYEVCNTYKERHTYVLPVDDPVRPVIRQACEKRLYVSPFIGMEATYHFRIVPPGAGVGIVIRQEDSEGLLLTAAFRGRRRALDDRGLLAAALRFPLLTFKIIAAIHWEALRLWLKGVPVFPHRPADEAVQSSAGKAAPPPTAAP